MRIWRHLILVAILAASLAIRAVPAAHAGGIPLATNPVKLSISQEGIYRLTVSYLQGQNVDLTSVQVSTLGLSDGGTPVPIFVQSQNPSTFGTSSGDYIEFYAHPVNNTYTTSNVYVLSDGVSAPARATSQAIGSATQTALTSGNTTYIDPIRTIYNPIMPPGYPVATTGASWPSDGDPHWNRAQLIISSSSPNATRTWNFTLPSAVPTGTCQLTVPGFGQPVSGTAINPTEELDLAINGQAISNPSGGNQFIATSSGMSVEAPFQISSVPFPCSDLATGSNSLTVHSALQSGVSFSEVWVQDFHITYPQNLCAQNNQLLWTWSPSGGGSYQIGGFSQAPTSIWQITSSGSTVLTGYSASTSLSGPCASGTYGVQFGDNLTGNVTYVATAAPLTPDSVTALDQTDIKSGSSTSAQYLIITNPLFVGTAPIQQLVTFEQGRGLTVKVVGTSTIFDQFGNGQPYPEAIHQYIQWAVAHLGTIYVLLAGGDTYDYHNYYNCPSSGQCSSANPNNVSLIPSLYVNTTYTGAVPSDHLFAVAAGDTTDSPNVAIGRLPAVSLAQLQTMVTKTVNWGTWSSQPGHLGAADFAAGYEDPTFQSSSDQMASLLPYPFTAHKFYETGDTTTDTTTSQNLKAAFSAGPEIVNYMGHGNFQQWSTLPLFQSSDVPNLTNGNAPSLVFQWGCQLSDYAIPLSGPSIDTTMLTDTYTPPATQSNPNPAPQPAGAVLTVGATGSDIAGPEETLAGGTADAGPHGAHYFYGYLARGYSVGQALEYASRDLTAEFGTSDGDILDVENTYEVLGDPSLTISRGPTAAAVTRFTAVSTGHSVALHWSVAAGTAIGFNIYDGSSGARLNHRLIAAHPANREYSVHIRTSGRIIRLEVIGLKGQRWSYSTTVRRGGG